MNDLKWSNSTTLKTKQIYNKANIIVCNTTKQTLLFDIIAKWSIITRFVLTAKSVALYKQLEDKKFAEKYLVGTLFSATIAIACIGIYNYFKI